MGVLATFVLTSVALRLVDSLHVAFLLPPGSPFGAMLPVVHGCLETGHNVTLLAYNDYEGKLKSMVPGAAFAGLGPPTRPQIGETETELLWKIPYSIAPFLAHIFVSLAAEAALGFPMSVAAKPLLEKFQPDVICVTSMFASQYALGEVLGIPTVGLFVGPQTILTVGDVPWSLEPAMGSWYSRTEIARNPLLLMLNSAIRVFAIPARVLATFLTNLYGFRLGSVNIKASQFDAMLANPVIVPSLPELTDGYPALNGPRTVMVGMFDHPALAGASLGKSDEHSQIISWLDQQHRAHMNVLYVAFGSEIVLSRTRIDTLISSFKLVDCAVLWALKRPPADLVVPSKVLIAKWTPQKVVLGHAAVKAFFSHGGQNSVREALAAGVPMLIMPIVLDGGIGAMIHEELGVALRVDKNAEPASIAGSVGQIMHERFYKAALEIKSLNDKHVNLSRAVEVIALAGNKAFAAGTQDSPSGLLLVVPFVILAFTRIMVGKCFAMCCWCCCRICRGGAETKNKVE